MTPVIRQAGVLIGIAALLSCCAFASDYPFEGLSDPATQLETLSQRCQENPTPELLTKVGWLLHVYRNENAQARSFFEKALEAQPENCWARYGLSVIEEMDGHFEEVLSHSLVLCEESPSHPASLLALLNIRGLFGQIADFDDRVESVLQPLLDQRRCGSVQFDEICREVLCAIKRTGGDSEGVKALAHEGRYVTKWRVVGPFGEHPNLSFLSKWPPEDDRALKSRYRSNGKVIRRQGHSSQEGAFRPRGASQGVYYGEAFLQRPSCEDVILRISSPFPVALFLNNHPIYVKDSIRDYKPLVEYVRTRLSPGYNRLLMKCLIGGWGFSGSASYKSLRLQCRSPQGSLAPTVQVFQCAEGYPSVSASASRRHWREVDEVEHTPYQPRSLDCFARVLEANPRDPIALGFCGILKSVQGNVQEAKRFLLAAEKHAPSYAYFQYVLGTVLNSDPTLPVQVRRSEAKSRFANALESAGTFPLALYELALLDAHEEQDLEAIDKLKKCVAQSPRFFSFHERLYRLYQKKSWQAEQKRQLEKMLALGVESCEPYHIAEDFYQATKQYGALDQAIDKLQSKHLHPEYLARHLSQSGEDSAGIAEYLKLKESRPKKEAIRKSLIQLYERTGRWVDAEKELEEAVKRFPKNISFWKMLAELKGYTGRKWGERQVWKRVLRQDPVDDEAWRAMRALGQRDPLDDYDIPSLPYVHDASIREKYAGVSSAIIIDQSVEEIYSNGSSRQKTHQLILLNDRKAIDRWGELHVPGDELLELRTIKPDGTILSPEPPEEGKTSVSMAGLQEGDFIEFKYITTASVPRDHPPRHLGSHFFFQSVEVPMMLSQYVVIVPADMKLQIEEGNNPPPVSVMRKRGKKVYKWEARDVPALPSEPLAAAETEFMPFVRAGINFDPDADILRYLDHNVSMTRITDEIRRTTAEVLANCPRDMESRTRAMYAFVTKEVRGGGGSAHLTRSASETLADRNGDRLSLAKAMLDAAGIKSRMLVARGRLAHASDVFPEPFRSGLLAVQDDDGQVLRYLDFSSRYLPFGYIRTSLQDGLGILVQDFSCSDFGLNGRPRKIYGERFSVPRFPTDDNCEKRTLIASVREDGSIEGTQVHDYTGDRAESLRTSLLGAEEYQIREFIERTANLSFRAATLTQHEVRSLSDPEKPLSISYSFRATNFGRITGREMILDQILPRSRPAAYFASLEARKTPLQINREINTRFKGVLELPPGTTVVGLPSSLRQQTKFGYYYLRFSEDDESIGIEFDLHLKAQRISPEEYPEFAAFCRAIDESERGEIRLQLQP